MNAVLLIDFGSTYTKVTAVDTDSAQLLGTAQSFTTIDSDISDGLNAALEILRKQIGDISFTRRLACSSAAGGLRMVTSGLVPSLTAEAARTASLGAGAKVVKTYAYQLTDEDMAEITEISPDIFLLTGGTDGGDTQTITHNAEILSGCTAQFPIIYAGNRSCAAKCMDILKDREVYRCDNVLPSLGTLHIDPVQDKIRQLFLRNIVGAKGLSKAQETISNILMPTPSAVLAAVKLLADGTATQSGLGELMAVDIGGATTDIYSIATGAPQNDNTILRGLPQPYSKRTVEGDIGMRYSAAGILEAAGAPQIAELSGLDDGTVVEMIGKISANPAYIPDTADYEKLDYALAVCAIRTAMFRHAGRVEQAFTPTGPVFVQTGKDLTHIGKILVTGGAVVHGAQGKALASVSLKANNDPYSLAPKNSSILIDSKYILSAMGLLSENFPDCALTMMKHTIN